VSANVSHNLSIPFHPASARSIIQSSSSAEHRRARRRRGQRPDVPVVQFKLYMNKSNPPSEAHANPAQQKLAGSCSRASAHLHNTRGAATRSEAHLASDKRAHSSRVIKLHRERAEREEREGEIMSQTCDKLRNISSVSKRRKLPTVPGLTAGNADAPMNEW